VENSGLEKNWKDKVQVQPHRSSFTSRPDSGDEFDQLQVVPEVQAIQKKQQTSAKVNMPGHQEGTNAVLLFIILISCSLQTLTNFVVRDKAPQS
jgi:hypothetical protein